MSHSSLGVARRTRSALRAALAISILGGTAGPVAAHHSFSAEFDANQPFELKGTVTKIRWVSPHSWLYFDVVDAKGEITNWGVEFGGTAALQRQGLSKADVAVGTEVAVEGFRARNGGPYGYSVNVTLPDGRVFKTGGAPNVPAQPAGGAAE